MAYRNPLAPATDRQMKWVHGLWKTAGERGLQVDISTIVLTKHPTWNEATPRATINAMLVNGAGPATMEMAGEFIAAALEKMPDKVPSTRGRTYSNANSRPAPSAPVRDGTDAAAKGLPPAAARVASATESQANVLVFVVNLNWPITQDQADTVRDLFGLFLKNKTSLPVESVTAELAVRQGEEATR